MKARIRSVVIVKEHNSSSGLSNVSKCERWCSCPTRSTCQRKNPPPYFVAYSRTSIFDADHFQSTIKNLIQTAGLFFLAQFIVTQFVGRNKQTADTPGAGATIPTYNERPDSSSIAEYSSIPQNIAPIWPTNSTIDLSIYVSPSIAMPGFKYVSPETLVVEEKGFGIGDWKENRDIDTSFAVPREVQRNGTLWAHFYVALQGYPLDPIAKNYDGAKAYHFSRPLNHVLPKKKVKKTKNLLAGSEQEETVEEVHTGPVFASYYHPNFTLSVIPDSGTLGYTTVHPSIRQYLVLESTGARDASGQHGWYYPILYPNTFWQLREHMTELNETVTRLPLRIKLNNLANWKFNLYATIDDSVKQTARNAATGTGPMPAAGDGSEFEEFKRVLVDTNIYLLCTTAFVSVLHMVFEGLAFKSDIVSFWSSILFLYAS